MSDFAFELLELEEEHGEPIEAIVVGEPYFAPAGGNENVVLTREAGIEKLSWADHNSPHGFAFYAWSASRVFFMVDYNGGDEIAWVPRNPVPIEPHGGGH